MSGVDLNKPDKPPAWPEHDKLAKVKHRSQAAGEFMTWLAEQGWYLARPRTEEEERANRNREWLDRTPSIVWNSTSMDELLARWLEIDRDALEAEKRAMLSWIRRHNRPRAKEGTETGGRT